jgi:hypothetical protein
MGKSGEGADDIKTGDLPKEKNLVDLSPCERAWLMVCEQQPKAVTDKQFLDMPLSRQVVESRWPRFVDTLGVSEEQALAIIEVDATPLLIEPAGIAEVLSRLAAISSREKALELVSWSPTLLLAGEPSTQKTDRGHGIFNIVDSLYAGRVVNVLNEHGRDPKDKLAEIELYSLALTGLKPIIDIMQQGGLTVSTDRLCRRPIEIAAQVVPSTSVRVFLSRVAAAPDPWGFLLDQAKAGMLMTSSLASRPPLAASIIPYSPSILPHLPSIYTRLTILRPHVPGIARILDPYFDVVEPHIDRIMERMDQIEPHLPYLLLHLDVLAPYCGQLLDHFDELMPYASSKEAIDRGLDGWKECYVEQSGSKADVDRLAACVIESWDDALPEAEIKMRYQEASYLPRLLPYVDFLAPRLDVLAPHLRLVHRHLPHILPYMEDLLPYIPLFTSHPKASANADVLVGYLGWIFRIPLVPKILYIPKVPKLVAELSTLLPRKLIQPVLERRRRRWEASRRTMLQTAS